MSDPAGANRAHWNSVSETYLARHVGDELLHPKQWGGWSVPEADLDVLGDVRGLDVLELGCGGAQWAVTLLHEGAAIVGLDISENQLAGASARCPELPLVQADGAVVPFRDSAFDLVFCDHGAMSWCNPQDTVPEVARILRPNGRLIFNCASPWLVVCDDPSRGVIDNRLHSDYFGLRRVDEVDGAASFVLGYGDWIRLFRKHGLVVEDLVEPRPSPGSKNGFYSLDPEDWYHHWPAESLWVTRKEGEPATRV